MTPGLSPASAASRARPRPWGRWLFVAVSLALLVYVVNQLGMTESMGSALLAADWRWIAVAGVLQVAFFVLYGALYEHGLRAVGVASETMRLVPVLLASIFAKTVLPLTAAPAAAVIIDDSVSRGESGPRTAVGLVVVLVVDLVAALPFVLAGTVALAMRDTLVAFAVTGTVLFAGFAVGLLVLLVLAGARPGWLSWLLRACRAAVDGAAGRLGRRAPLGPGWAERIAGQLVEAVVAIPGHWPDLARATGASLLLHVANLGGLAALFLAFGQPLEPAALLAGFAMSIVFFVVAIVPDGIGAVEGAMALVFVQLGMAPAPAVVVTIAYRVLNIWIPVMLGFWYARRLRLFGAGPATRGTGVSGDLDRRPAGRPALVPVEALED